MRIEVVAAGFKISVALRRSVEQRLLFALSRFGPGVERVVVRLSDDANPLGGVDRRCRMRAWLERRESVRVETVDGSLAIERAVERLARHVEWVLVDGRGTTDSRLPPEALPVRAQERDPSESPPASRTRRVARALPASRKKPRT